MGILSTPPSSGYSPGYEGIWGFRGTNAMPQMLRGDTKCFYINPGHASASDDNDGTDPIYPLATFTELITRTVATNLGTSTVRPILEDYDTVFICDDISESVVTGLSTTMPNHITVMGVAGSEWGPTWTSDNANLANLSILCEGWTLCNIHFVPPTGMGAVELFWDPAKNYNAHRTSILDCEFDGMYTGHYGIVANGAPYDIVIKRCRFREMKQGGGDAFAIYCSGSSTADPYMWVIEDNVFWENDNHIGSANHDYGLNCSLIKGNVFHDGVGIAATLKLDLRGGSVGKNIVVGNYFGGDYSNPGGYYPNAGAPGNWIGNLAEDIAEGEVEASGWTNAPPAA